MDVDLLTDEVTLPPGHVVLAAGNSDPRSVRPWQLVMDNQMPTARLLPLLSHREVTLLSSVEVYGSAPAPQREETPLVLPLNDEALGAWASRGGRLGDSRLPALAGSRALPRAGGRGSQGRWAYAMAKHTQELMVASVVPPERLTVFRVANLFGVGQDHVVARLVRRALAGLPLAVTDNQRTFLAVGRPDRGHHDRWVAGGAERWGGSSLAGRGRCAGVLDELGVSADVEIRPAPDPDSGRSRRHPPRSGDAWDAIDDQHLDATIRAYVRRLVEASTPFGRVRVFPS